ncbi:septum formation protein Maf [Solemya elarraichensis gill symbiont]|uniref:dTTP/UTP pyrophosphatase n=1 Tax=Solemya elarraichensis gill symbiont TaxID=1918949 RepID=A0A1T2LCB3_9GAMM|nr:septum formation protein Maf [Solemya elarraichensis gill symbiont]
MSTQRIILASASPRRLELLRQIGISPDVHPAHIDETPFDDEAAADYVIRMAREKAAAVASCYTANEMIISADTSVILDNRILGKPRDAEDFISMFIQLSGCMHEVLSAVSLATDGRHGEMLSSSRVWFRDISEAEILAYWETNEPTDKAGGYGIQGKGALFIEKIEGSYSGIMGLPLYETGQLLQRAGYKL